VWRWQIAICKECRDVIASTYELRTREQLIAIGEVTDTMVRAAAKHLLEESVRYRSVKKTYCIASEKYAKIGVSVDPKQRLYQLRQKNRDGVVAPEDLGPKEKLEILWVVEGNYEVDFHKRLRHLWVCGEWFHRTEEVERLAS